MFRYSFGELFEFDKSFENRTEFIYCLRKMLAIFDGCSPQYTFCVHQIIKLHKIHLMSLVNAILELPSVQESNNVRLSFLSESYYRGKKFYRRIQQIDAIVDWLHHLHRSYANGTQPIGHSRSLTIGSTEREHILMISTDNIEHLIDILKVVGFYKLKLST